MKLHQNIQYLPLPLRLVFIPIALLSLHLFQLQMRVFNVLPNEHYQKWAIIFCYSGAAIALLYLVAWDQIRIPLKFMYSCFFKPIGDHGNDQQSRLESFYQDQAKSRSICHKYIVLLLTPPISCLFKTWSLVYHY